MLVPINWVNNYIKVKHNDKQFGEIMTDLEFMLDSPIKNTKWGTVFDLEVRQNRPDVLSIIGVAREYAAFINAPVKYPQQVKSVKFKKPKDLIKVETNAKKVVKRFAAIEILNVKAKESPKFIKDSLNAYGIEPINILVDITNYVMLEYGIPMHAFDLDKLPKLEGKPLLTLRMANTGETFATWQGTKAKLDKSDLVVTDAKNRLVSIGGITGEAQSGISDTTVNILLEAANYDHAYIRRSALKHNIHTDSSSRHSKILPSDMVQTALLRALFLVKKYAEGKVGESEDYYRQKQVINSFTFDLQGEVNRLGGTNLTTSKCVKLLKQLGFGVEKISFNKVKVIPPVWRTDINYDEDIVEEVLRLWGYENIPTQQINEAPPKNITDKKLILESKLREIMLSLGLSEQITEPLVLFENLPNQIELSNPLNKQKNALRTSIKPNLEQVSSTYRKSGIEDCKLFEVGKIYFQNAGKYSEENVLQTFYSNTSFEKVKADLLKVFNKLGIKPKVEYVKNSAVYTVKKDTVAKLDINSYELYVDKLLKLVKLDDIPKISFNTTFVQTIVEKITVQTEKNENLDKTASFIKDLSKDIESVYIQNKDKDIYSKGDKKSVTFTVVFENSENKLTREDINKQKGKIFDKLESVLNLKVERPK